jgi:hypothetical protein
MKNRILAFALVLLTLPFTTVVPGFFTEKVVENPWVW